MTTSHESDFYPSFEDFMREDKLPPVFPSSQSSETQLCSQHLISELCDRDTFGPFGIGINEDDLPPNFTNSSLAYSPKSIPPRSPSEDNSYFNLTSASSSTLDPAESTITDENMDAIFEAEESLHEDIVNVEGGVVPLLENHELIKYLDDLPDSYINEDFTHFACDETPLSPSPPPLTLTPLIPETPTVSIIKSEHSTAQSSPIHENHLETSDSSSSIKPEQPSLQVKKPASRGRKRKLFSNCDEKKKDQNKEAARRYREKKKLEDARLEAEEEQLLIAREKLRKEMEMISRTHSEFLSMLKEIFQQNKRKKP